MPHETVKFLPGVDQNKTPALNQAAVSFCNLVRQMIDRNGVGLWQKLGGWTRYFPDPMPAIVRALWGWSDTNNNKWLAVGCQTAADPAEGAPVRVIGNNSLQSLRPLVRRDNVAVALDTTTGSNLVTIDNPASNVSNFDTVHITTHIAVGGVVVFGLYRCFSVSPSSFQIETHDLFDNPDLAHATVINGGAVASFATVANNPTVTVTLAAHDLQAGDQFPVLIAVSVGGLTVVGDYIVQRVVDANHFVILSASVATATASAAINGGLARYEFYLGTGPLPGGTGYGVGGYGKGGYGSGVDPVAPAGTPIKTNDWVFDNWGDILIMCPVETDFGSAGLPAVHGGPIFFWPPATRLSIPQVMSSGPEVNDGVFVAMPQRQLIAWGSTFGGIQDPLLVRWCDVDNFTVWIGTPTNQAGSRRLSRGSRIVSGIQLGLQGLLITDVGAWTMQYVAGQGVYSIQEVARGCGCIGRKALGTLNQSAYWMGPSQFFSIGDGGVAPMPCPIWDRVFKHIYPGSENKIRFAGNSLYSEVGWFYASDEGDGEVDSYVKCNTLMPPGQGWDYGKLSRTAWIDQTVLGPPIGADGNNLMLYAHETSNDADEAAMPSFIRTGYFVLTEADLLMFVDQMWPDFKWGYGESDNATVKVTFFVKNYPADPDTVYGPFSLTRAVKWVTPRFRGRLVSLEFRSEDIDSFWRVGSTRYRSQPDGKVY